MVGPAAAAGPVRLYRRHFHGDRCSHGNGRPHPNRSSHLHAYPHACSHACPNAYPNDGPRHPNRTPDVDADSGVGAANPHVDAAVAQRG